MWQLAISEARREILAWVEQRLLGIVGWTLTARSSPLGNEDQVEGEDGSRHGRPVQRIEPFGLRSRAPKGLRALWLRLGTSNVVFIGIAPTGGYGPQNLEEGETALYSIGGALALLDKDGNVVFNKGTLRMARETDALDVGALTAVTVDGKPVLFSYAPGGGGTPVVQQPSVSLAGIIASGTGAEHVKG
jgi:phage gp45-like